MMYLAYDEYVAMGGTLEHAPFSRLCTRASTMITRLTHGRLLFEKPVRDAAKYATYDMIEAMHADQLAGADGREIASMSNDGVSITYAQSGSCDARCAGIAKSYLSTETDKRGVPLMYAGVD